MIINNYCTICLYLFFCYSLHLISLQALYAALPKYVSSHPRTTPPPILLKNNRKQNERKQRAASPRMCQQNTRS